MPKNQPQQLLVRLNTAARMLDVSRSTVYKMVKAGDLKLVKIGPRASAVTVGNLEALIEARKA